MEDERIVDLYWAREESAITETQQKYGKYCLKIAWNVLANREDSEECVNDTWMKAWNAMPTARPGRLSAFLGKITRNLALDRFEKNSAKKRGEGQVTLVLEELQDCLPDATSVDQSVHHLVLREVLNEFLRGQTEKNRSIFLRRYWYLSPVKEIAEDFHMSESAVKMNLLRSREKLRKCLEKEGGIPE
ncbi:MAG: sigma-70 family RNA polymerase sigma factor [Lachnospiraceae bacterium]|nr:sigma-70 family RNA polymerase sigma factor [Lachnospiraceae bacterium]